MIKMQAYCKFENFDAFTSRCSTRLSLFASHHLAKHQLTLTVKENRSKYKDLDFKEQQKALGTDVRTQPMLHVPQALLAWTVSVINILTFPQWKASSENPKNNV
jgi:hypothetical protein